MQVSRLISLSIILGIFHFARSDDSQFVEFYKEPGCVQLVVRKNDTDLTILSNRIPFVFNATSVRVNGFWAVTRAITDTQSQTTTGLFQMECRDRTSTEFAYSAIVRFGPSKLDESDLALYTEQTFSGIRFSSGRSDNITLPRRMTTMSWHLSGSEPWTAYENTNFTGSSECISPKRSNNGTGTGIDLNLDTKWTLGSARRGCNGACGILISYFLLISSVFFSFLK